MNSNKLHTRSNNSSFGTCLRAVTMPLLVLGSALALSGCAGMRVGPGTATGALIGGAASVITHDGGRAAVIGTGVGAAVDILGGDQPLSIDQRRYNDGRIYRDDRRDERPVYRDPRYYDERPVYRPLPRVYRPVPAPLPRPQHRYYDERCGCYFWR